MKNSILSSKNLVFCAALLLVLCLSASVGATPIYVGNGADLEPDAKNDDVDAVLELIDIYNGAHDPNLPGYEIIAAAKYEVGVAGWLWEYGEGLFDVVFSTTTNDDGEQLAGTWDWADGVTPFDTYYAIKASRDFSLYFVYGDDTGPFAWDTAGVDNKGLSHLTFYRSTPVPEPATMLLFGAGLAGLATLGRRRKNRE